VDRSGLVLEEKLLFPVVAVSVSVTLAVIVAVSISMLVVVVVDGRRMNRVADLLDDGVEAVVVVGRVLDHPDCAVGFVHRVRALHHVSVPLLVGGLHVAGVRVVYAVVVCVFRVGLRDDNQGFTYFYIFISKRAFSCYRRLYLFHYYSSFHRNDCFTFFRHRTPRPFI
jgi:hypothetical protein